jgi:hypothetical protein
MKVQSKRMASVVAAPVAATALALTGFSATPASAASSLPCRAWMSNSRPADYTATYVRVQTVKFAHVRTIAHYKTTNTRKYGTANSAGRASIRYWISGATPGYRVRVSVAVHSGSRAGYCSTYFVPHR